MTNCMLNLTVTNQSTFSLQSYNKKAAKSSQLRSWMQQMFGIFCLKSDSNDYQTVADELSVN